MSAHIEINGRSLLLLKDVAKDFSYTKDYVARLAREQKIVATQLGRQWYIDPLSLRNFVQVSELEQGVRRQYLSDERKKEQTIKTAVKTLQYEKEVALVKTLVKPRLVTVAVLLVGFMFGGVIYSNGWSFSNFQAKQNLASKFEITDVTMPNLGGAAPMPTAVYTTVSEQMVDDVEEVIVPIYRNNQGIFLFADGGSGDEVSLPDLFSDDVEVEVRKGDGSLGVIIYTDQAGNRIEREFVSVPKPAPLISE